MQIKDSYFNQKIVDLTLTNKDEINSSTVSLFGQPTESELSSNTTTEHYIRTDSIGSALFGVTPSGWEIYKISTAGYVTLLANQGTAWTRAQLQTALDTETGLTWSFEQSGSDTYFYTTDSSASNYRDLRFPVSGATVIGINDSETQTGTTTTIDVNGDLSYNEINAELNNGRYVLENVDIYADTVAQLNSVFQKNFKAMSGYNFDSNITPTLNPNTQQFVAKNVPLEMIIDKSTLDFTLGASEDIRLIFKYQHKSLLKPKKKAPPIEDFGADIVLPKSRIKDNTPPMLKISNNTSMIKTVLSKIMYNTPKKQRRQRIIEETKKHKISNQDLNSLIAFFENSDYKELD